MEMNRPFIHLFNNMGNFYLYDVNLNQICRISKDTYLDLKKLLKDENNFEIETKREICKFKNAGLLSDKRPIKLEHPVIKYLPCYLNHRMRHMILQITQDCNFRCTYCIYSENANEKQRTHLNKKMDWETAKKAIDFFIQHSSDIMNTCSIGFYGGEPLLEIKTIKKCVEYIKYEYSAKDIRFNISTNGSLLSDENIEFLLKYNFLVQISLDATKDINDKNRRLASDGLGTFDMILSNIEKICSKYTEFLKNININAVYDPENDFSVFNKALYLIENKYHIKVKMGVLDDSYSISKIYYNKNYTEKYNYELFLTLLHKLGRLPSYKITPAYNDLLSDVDKLSAIIGVGGEIVYRGGPCIPALNRLFISVDGNFYPCEKVSEHSPCMYIGNLDEGFDIKNIINLLNIGKLTEKQCCNCWAIRYCKICAKHADGGINLSRELINKQCFEIKLEIERIFKYYTLINNI